MKGTVSKEDKKDERAMRIPVKQDAQRDARGTLSVPPSASSPLLWIGLKGRMEDERARARAKAVVGGSDDTCVE